jgi:AraC-like DNA-binding protein
MGDAQQDDSTPLEGEIVFVPQRSRQAPGGRGFGNRSNYNVFVDEDIVREVVALRTVHNWTLRKIAEKYGMSPETVRRWCGESTRDRRAKDVDIVGIRLEAAAHLEEARHQAWRIHDEAAGHKAQLDALGKVNELTSAHARLMGLNAPVRVDLQVSELTEAERELQEMINEAKASEATREAEVIRAASEDPDL